MEGQISMKLLKKHSMLKDIHADWRDSIDWSDSIVQMKSHMTNGETKLPATFVAIEEQ